eukprot:g867.t1
MNGLSDHLNDSNNREVDSATQIDGQTSDASRQRGLSVIFGGSSNATTEAPSTSSKPPQVLNNLPTPQTDDIPASNPSLQGSENHQRSGGFVDTGVNGGLAYTNTGNSPPSSPISASNGQDAVPGNAPLQHALDEAQRRIASLEGENQHLKEQMQEVKRGAEAYAKSLEQTMHEEIEKERNRSADERKALQSSLEGSHAAVLSDLNAQHASSAEALQQKIDQLQAEVAEGKRIIEEMKANEQSFRDAFVAEMQKEFDEGSDSEADSMPEEDSIPLQLLDSILKEDEIDSNTATPEDINLDDLNIDALLEGNERILTQKAQDQQEVQHQVYQAEAPASNSLDVPEGTVLGHRNSDAEDYAMLAGAMSTIAENDSADAAEPVGNGVPANNGSASQQQKSEYSQPRQEQSSEIESFAEGDTTAEEVAASPWIMVNDEQYGSYFWNQETQDSTYEFPNEGYYTPDGNFVTPQQSMAFAAEQAAANEAARAAASDTSNQQHDGNTVEKNEAQQEQNPPSDANLETSLQQDSLEQPSQNAQPQQNSQPPSTAPSPRNSGVVEALEAAGVAKRQKRQMSEIQKGLSTLARILSANDDSMTDVFKTNLEGIRKAADASQ